MLIYVVRHAEAEQRTADRPDEWRHLTAKGRKEAELTGRVIADCRPRVRTIITSPLTRAVQTAEIIAGFASRKRVVEASPLLVPGVDAAEVLDLLRSHAARAPVMLVGHEPQVGGLVAALLGLKQAISLKKGACVAVSLGDRDKAAEFLWHAVPGKKRITSLKKAFAHQ